MMMVWVACSAMVCILLYVAPQSGFDDPIREFSVAASPLSAPCQPQQRHQSAEGQRARIPDAGGGEGHCHLHGEGAEQVTLHPAGGRVAHEEEPAADVQLMGPA